MDKKQKILIENVIGDHGVFAKSYKILKPSYFTAPLDEVVEFVIKYFQSHRKPPGVDVIEAETDVKLRERVVEEHEMSYTLEEIEDHCRSEALKEAILSSADMIHEGNTSMIMETIRQAMTVRMDRVIGTSLYNNVVERIRVGEETSATYSSGLESVDEIIGRIRIPDFGMVYAVSSGGKSLMLGNMANSFSEQGLEVVIVTLELKEELYSKRMDSIITGYDINEHWKAAEGIAEYYENKCKDRGKITIKKMIAGSTANDIDAYLLDYSLETGRYPDVLIVDYLGLMGVDNIKSNNKFDIDHEKSIGLIRLGEMYNMAVVSAGQINRDGYDVVKVTPQHCAGGISVVNNSDWSIALVATEEDLDNDQVQVAALKIRHTQRQTGAKVIYKNPRTLKFSDEPNFSEYKTPKEGNRILARAKKSEKNDAEPEKVSQNTKQEPKKTTSKGSKGKSRVKSAIDLIHKR